MAELKVAMKVEKTAQRSVARLAAMTGPEWVERMVGMKVGMTVDGRAKKKVVLLGDW